MNGFLVEEIDEIIKSVPDKDVTNQLLSVIYSLGRDADNEEEYEYAFSTLMGLYERDNQTVKANVIRSFALLAVLKKHIKLLDRAVVEPLILKTYSQANEENKQMIQNAMDDINYSLKWNM